MQQHATTPVHPHQAVTVHQHHAPGELTVADLVRQQGLIQSAMKQVMTIGHHYGEVPGTRGQDGEVKQTLLKPGAEKLCALFCLTPQFDVQITPMDGGHREYSATCTLTHRSSGAVVASAMGSCSTMESKYRWRNAKPKCPDCGVEAIFKSKNGPGWFCWGKHGGCGANFGNPKDPRIVTQKVGRAENPDIADQYNTCLKMAEKRALVAAVLLATAASDMFIPEDEEPEQEVREDGPPAQPQRAQQPQQRQTRRTQQKPAEEPSLKDQLIHTCMERQELLLGQGRTKQQLIDLLGKEGIVMTKWGDLDEQQLQFVADTFAHELSLGREVQS